MKRNIFGDILWVILFVIITALLFIPNTQQTFIQLTVDHPYWMGFFKFAILATLGEMLALRLANQAWTNPAGLVFKIIVWGLIGVLITFMFSFYAAGVSALIVQGKINTPSGLSGTVYTAFLTSLIMNLTFGIVFMGLHRLSDTYIEMRASQKRPSFKALVENVDWKRFINFVVGKTIPLFWIPAHTITFSLPPYLRVVVAAYLSIVLGLILAYSGRTEPQKSPAS